MKTLNFKLYGLLVICFCTFNCSKDENNNDPVNFTLSKSEALAFEEVRINFEGSREISFFIDTPGGFQREFSRFSGGDIGIELGEIGTYRITQLGFNNNFQEIEVFPNVVFWSDFPGNPIDITISESVSGEEQQGQVNCVIQSPPDCFDFPNTSCSGFAMYPGQSGFVRSYTASDGVNSWNGSILLEPGICHRILLTD